MSRGVLQLLGRRRKASDLMPVGAKRFARSLSVLIAVAGPQAVIADSRPLVQVRFEVALQSLSPVPLRGELNLVPGDGREAPERAVSIGSENGSRVDLPAGSSWRVSVTAPGFWVRRLDLEVGAAGEQVERLEAWPLGFLIGRLTTTEEPPVFPQKVVVTTLPARVSSKHRNAPKGEIDCPVDGKGRFRCELPAATFDLSIFAAPYVPRYTWDVSVPAGGDADLKTIALVRGASLAGWVESLDDPIDPESCRVSITPAVAAGGNDRGAIEKLNRMTRQERVNAHGFFQVVGLPAGQYSVAAVQGEAFTEPTGPFEVAAQGETYLPEPLRLVPPLDLELAVDPPLDPKGKPWSIHVGRAIDPIQFEDVFDGKTSEEGSAKVPRQRPGRFSFRILNSGGQRMLTEQDVLIESQVDAVRLFKIHWIEVEGSIRLGDEPLPTSLWFGGKSGPTSIRIDSDKEGRFRGALSRDGHWRIDLAADSPPIALQLRRSLEAKEGKARLDIEVPDTRIFGRVVSPSGQPEPLGMVSVLEPDGASQILASDSAGRFELRGVAPGEVGLTAETQRGDFDSDQVILDLGTGAEIGPIELKLQKKTRFRGRVLTSRGAAGGAAVAVVGTRPARFGNDRTRTAADGRFEARLPGGVESAIAVVAALGSALTAFELKPGPSVDLLVADLRGAVEVGLGAPLTRRVAEEDVFLMLFQNGLEIPSRVLADWARSHGEPAVGGAFRRLPALAPGSYSACLVPVTAFLDLTRTGWSPKLAVECRSGSLAPGGTLRLEFGKPDEKVGSLYLE